jgi:hypothetical protein
VLSRKQQQYRLAQHYLTLPLAGEWRPRTSFRWQPVLSLGGTVSWLLRGSYLAGSDGCNCQTQTQSSASAGPFRPVSTAVTAGIGFDYALGLRSTLLVRPAATYSLTSPGNKAGGRLPASIALQVGVLFDARRAR